MFECVHIHWNNNEYVTFSKILSVNSRTTQLSSINELRFIFFIISGLSVNTNTISILGKEIFLSNRNIFKSNYGFLFSFFANVL